MRKRKRLLKGDHLNLVARWQHSSDVTDVAEILLLLSAGVGSDVDDISKQKCVLASELHRKASYSLSLGCSVRDIVPVSQ